MNVLGWLLTAVGAIAYLVYAARVQQPELEAARSDLLYARSRLSAMRSDNRQVPELEARIRQLEAEMKLADRNLLPPSDAAEGALEQARNEALALAKDVKASWTVGEWVVPNRGADILGLELEGEREAILRYLSRVLSLPRPLAITRLELTGKKAECVLQVSALSPAPPIPKDISDRLYALDMQVFEPEFDELNEVEKTYCVVRRVDLEVLNGGFEQLYFNDGKSAALGVEAFQRMGDPATAEIVRSANGKFGPSGPPVDPDQLDQALGKLPDGAFSAEDDRYGRDQEARERRMYLYAWRHRDEIRGAAEVLVDRVSPPTP